MPPVRKFVKRFGTATKLFGLSFLIGVFLAKVSETSASGNLAKVSVVNILCVVGLGTSFTTLNVLSSYSLLSVLPWFSDKSTVTLSIQSCIRVVGLAATIIDVLPDDSADKGLLVLPMVFVYPATLLVLNCFVYCTKVKEEGTSADKDSLSSDHVPQYDKDTENVEGSSADKDSLSNDHVPQHDKDTENYLCVGSKINEVAVFTIYTDEMSVRDDKNL